MRFSRRTSAQAALAVLLTACTSTPPPRPPPRSVKAADKPAVLVRLGDDTRRAGDPQDAVTLYRSANGASPHDPVPLTRMGEGLNDTDDPERAEQAFRGALALNPKDEGALRGLAIALLAEGRPADAYGTLQQLDTNHDPHLLRLLGTSLDLMGRNADAQTAYRRGLALAPTDSALHGNLALSLALTGDRAGALAEMRAAIASPQPDPRQEANAVMVLALLGETDEARARGTQTVGDVATEKLLARVSRVEQASNAASRAAALGVITSNAASAPPAPHPLLPPPDTAAKAPAATAGVNAVPVPEAAAPAAGSADPARSPNPN
jgi:Flp pilus assembly protein TadD